MKNCDDCVGFRCNWAEDVTDKKYCPRFGIVAWQPAHVYPTASIGKNVSIGRFAEIGHNVVVDEDTRIGKGAFIPEGVVIGKRVFIGPHVCFTNDKKPPSPKDKWETTEVLNGAKIGAAACILPGVTIGRKALVGAGAVVTKWVPPETTVVGNPAAPIKKKGGWRKGKSRK